MTSNRSGTTLSVRKTRIVLDKIACDGARVFVCETMFVNKDSTKEFFYVLDITHNSMIVHTETARDELKILRTALNYL